MTIVLATYTTAPGKDGEVADLLRSYTALVLEEPGCLAFEVYRSVDDRHRFLLLEKYVDRAAFEAHQATEHFTRSGGQPDPPVARRPQRRDPGRLIRQVPVRGG